MMRGLIDFLNHGVLPFTGREAECRRVVEFWRGVTEAPGLQAMLLVGEAGVGKSRLIEEVVMRVSGAGGAVVHTKLYPETPTAIAPLLSRAIWRFASGQPSLKIEPEETLGSVTAALRRLVRLRQTIVVIEDVHLFASDTLADLATVLGALADEQFVLLCAARPRDLPVRGVLERYMVDEIELAGFRPDAMEEILAAVLGGPAPHDVVGPFLAATAGNPLAVRSALRGAIQSGALVQDGPNREWRLTLDSRSFTGTLDRNVRLLSEGMAVHLSAEECAVAERIACLGEVVAYETACSLISDGDRLLESLTFKGILSPTGESIPSLRGESSRGPLLSFTHSLLHRRFTEEVDVDVPGLIGLLASDLPLYSVVPFQLLDGQVAAGEISSEVLQAATLCTIGVAQHLDGTSDWRMALPLWAIAEQLFDATSPLLDEPDRLVLHARLLNCRLRLLRRDTFSSTFHDQVRLLLELTSDPSDQATAIERIQALVHYFRWQFRHRNFGILVEIWESVEAVCQRFPSIRYSGDHIDFLRNFAQGAGMSFEDQLHDLVREHITARIFSDDIDPQRVTHVRKNLLPHLLRSFSNEKELADMTESVREIEQHFRRDDAEFAWQVALFEMSIGEVRSVMSRLDILLPMYKERALFHTYTHAMLVRLCCLASLGRDSELVEQGLDEIMPYVPSDVGHSFWHLCGDRLATVAALRGDSAWTARIIERFLHDARDRQAMNYQAMLALAVDSPDEELLAIARQDTLGTPVCRAISLLFDSGSDLTSGVEVVRRDLREPVLRRDDVLQLRSLIDVVVRADALHGRGLATELRQEIHDALVRMLEWLDGKSLVAFIPPIVDRYAGFLNRQEITRWRARIAALTLEMSQGESRVDRDDRIRLVMFGKIEVVLPEHEPVRPRGARVRTLLGLLTADGMLQRPLAQREFVRLCATDVPDYEDARKTMHLTVHRLRELIGHETILTDGETPRLNPALVSVDLLDVHRLLTAAEDAIREGSFLRAVPSLLEALEIFRGEIPFPSLYDEFFDAAREDFGNRVRSVTTMVARGLLRESDLVNAVELLRRATAALSDDADLAELYSVALVRGGYPVDSERYRVGAASAHVGSAV